MTKITANSMKCASVSGCAHTAVVHLAGSNHTPVEVDYEAPPVAQSGSPSGSIPNTKIRSE